MMFTGKNFNNYYFGYYYAWTTNSAGSLLWTEGIR